MSGIGDLPDRMRAIRLAIREEYFAEHEWPWVIGFSGGKDSTLVAQLVIETLLAIPPDERRRPVSIVSNDTLVESPVYQSAVDAALNKIRDGLTAIGLPVPVAKTRPLVTESFWVNLLGRGYPAPNRNFRWCTDRMKIRPTTRYIREQIDQRGGVVLLLGVRRAESTARSQRIDGYAEQSEGRLNRHNDIAGCWIMSPIVDLSDDDVWHILLNNPPPWGGNHRALWTLYRNALGGECPFVMSQDDAPSCGTSSARFGCWTCTVVSKDNSINALIEAGFEHLEPLSAFRDRLIEVSGHPHFRSKVRRNGQPGLGPLTFEARHMLLDELRTVQDAMELPLISEEEIRLIEAQWERDRADALLRIHEKLAPAQEDAT